jgi:hypothetical protein
MTTEARKMAVLGIGALGSETIPGMYFDSVGGLYDCERAGQEPLKLRNGHKARDVSPTRLQIRQASTGKSMADAEQLITQNLFERIAGAAIFKTVPAAELAVAFDDPREVMGPARAYAKRHPLHRLLAITRGGRSHAQGCPLTTAVGKDNPFLATWHVDPDSPCAQIQSRRRQMAFLINAFNACAMAPSSFVHNPTVGDITEKMGERGCCFQTGFGSAPLAGSSHGLRSLAHKTVGGRYRLADAPVSDALAQSRRATELALQPGSQTTAEAIVPDNVVYMQYIAPIETRGEIFHEYIERMSIWLTANVPSATPVFVAGPGLRRIDDEGERFVLATAFAAMAKTAGKGR